MPWALVYHSSAKENIYILAKKRCNPKAYGELNKQYKEQGNSHVSYVGQSEVPDREQMGGQRDR